MTRVSRALRRFAKGSEDSAKREAVEGAAEVARKYTRWLAV